MIEYIRKLIMFFFNLVHIYYHQKSIGFYLKNKLNKIVKICPAYYPFR